MLCPFLVVVLFVPSGLRHLLQHLPFQDGSESHNRNLQAVLTNGVVSCSTLSDQGYAEDFYDQHDKLRILVVGYFQWLALYFCSSWGRLPLITIVFSWGDNISPDGFLPSILLLLVIIVAVSIVVKAGANEFHRQCFFSLEYNSKFPLQVIGTVAREIADSVRSNPADKANSAFSTFEIESICHGSSLSSSDVVEEDDRKWARFLGGKISLGRKKSRGSNSGDGGNTKDGGKIVNGVIGARGGGIGEMASEAKRSLDKSSEGSEEMFPGEAGE
ncbi:hypothetical protein Tco_0381279 [Tanacetum coccineum]